MPDAAYASYFTPPPSELVTVSTIRKFADTTGAPAAWQRQSNGGARPLFRCAGATRQIVPGLNAGIDSYYKKARDLIDEGQFGPALRPQGMRRGCAR